VELEFAGLDTADAAAVVADFFDAAAEAQSPFRFTVPVEHFGDFTVELDTQFVHPEKDADSASDSTDPMIADVQDRLRQALGRISQSVVPVEVVSPPVPFDKLEAIDALAAALRDAGAQGTGSSLINAFGMHLNPEAATLDPLYLLSVLRGYVLAEDWLRVSIGLDATRRLLPYANPFPDPYVRLLADPDYRPDRDRMIDDYLAANPTRNRGLDMLPLFCEIDEERCRATVDSALVSARPAFHYRLPDCRIDDPHWSVVAEWNRWLTVERLAEDTDRLDAMGAAFLDQGRLSRAMNWAEQSAQWLSSP
jgi:hypothetical protein